MDTIINESDRHWSGLAGVVFLWALSAIMYWVAAVNHQVGFFIWFMISGWVLFSFILIYQFIRPTVRILEVGAESIDWELRLPDSKTIRDSVTLSSIKELQFRIPRLNGTSHSPAAARMIFLLTDGKQKELPFDFSPGVNRGKILQSILDARPDVNVQDVFA
jgi:hypothetical protein